MSLAIKYRMKKARGGKCMADGGMLTNDGYQSECNEHCNSPCEVHEQASGFVDETAPDRMPNHHGETDSGYQTEAHEEDMISRILAKRMSEGGKVANSDEPTADFDPNEFDELHLDDDLDFSYTGANSGDEKGNAGEDERRDDIVSRILASRRKRAGHNPRPA